MRFRCVRCGPMPHGLVFSPVGGSFQCPKCGRSGPPHVYRLQDVHFIVMHPDGIIYGMQGNQYVACEPKRDGLAQHSHDEYAATDHAPSVTCPACRRTREWRTMMKLFPDAAVAEEMRRAGGMVLGPGGKPKG
jgi:hypothetical protein